MLFPLTSPFSRDYAFHTSANSEAEIGVLGSKADNRPQCGFFTSVAWPSSFMGGSCGEPKGSPVLTPVRQPARVRPPDWRLGADYLNRLVRSHTMPKASKRASAQIVSPVLKCRKGDLAIILEGRYTGCIVDVVELPYR